MMKSRSCAVLAACALGLSAGSAFAEDSVSLAQRPASASGPSFDWSGVYAGVNVGYGWGDIDTSDNSITTTGPLVGLPRGTFTPAVTYGGDDSSVDAKGWLGGVQIGFNHQIGAWVLGIEADYQAIDFDDSNSFLGSPAGPYYQTRAEVESFGTVRARIGYAFDNLLLFGTGGLAVGEAEARLSIQGGVPGAFAGPRYTDTASETMVGYAIGAGAEWAIANSAWSLKAEYLHVDFGSKRFDFSFPATGGDTATTRGKVDLDIVRVGLNYRF